MRFRYHHPIPNFFKVENPINPLTATTDNKFIYDYPIKIESSLEDGKIIFNIGE